MDEWTVVDKETNLRWPILAVVSELGVGTGRRMHLIYNGPSSLRRLS
jgi:hypothetical protein